MTAKRWFGRVSVAYAATGLLLGLGAPVGALLLHSLIAGPVPIDLVRELGTHSFFYLYDLIGTSLVFSVAGYVPAIVPSVFGEPRRSITTSPTPIR